MCLKSAVGGGVTTVMRRLLALVVVSASAQLAWAATGVIVLSTQPESKPVIVLYPARAVPSHFERGPYVFQFAPDATPLGGNGHLVVMSHGFSNSPWPMADLAQALVKAGFTVAMPDNSNNNFRYVRDVELGAWRNQPKDVSQAIQALKEDARFAPLLDFQHVGFYGMSAGGLTALMLAGARWSPALLAEHCNAHLPQEFSICVGLATELSGSAFDRLRLAVARQVIRFKMANDTAWESWNDPRITAVVAAVPIATPFDMGSLAQPRIPLGLVRAGQDAWLAPQLNVDAVRAACKSCILLSDIPGANHGSLLSPQVPGISPQEARLLHDLPGFDRGTLPGAYAAIVNFFSEKVLLKR